MESWGFPDGNIIDLLEKMRLDPLQDINHKLQMHSSLVRRLSLDKELQGHQSCVNALAWNSSGSLLISGSDDTRIDLMLYWLTSKFWVAVGLAEEIGTAKFDQIMEKLLKMNIWSYKGRRLLHSIETGHNNNIFCTKFVPETSDELVVSAAADAEVEVGNPNVVWSASEDGTLRQHDFREGSSCPLAGSSNQECHNVLVVPVLIAQMYLERASLIWNLCTSNAGGYVGSLVDANKKIICRLDLRCGLKKSLADPPNQCLALKSCDISSTRPHQLLVGGSDSFARLYDRRMLPPLSSCQTKMKPPKCVNYFCPMHLSERLGSAQLKQIYVSYLLPSPGQILSARCIRSGQSSMRYSAGDYSKHIRLAPPISCGSEIPSLLPTVSAVSSVKRNNIADKLDMYHKLVQVGEKSLKEASAYMYGIEACCEVLDGKGPEIGDALKHECLCTRAALFLKRKWKNDVHMAIRDCNKARKINPSSFRAHYYMSEALAQLGELKEALDYAIVARHLAPSSIDVSERIIYGGRNIKIARSVQRGLVHHCLAYQRDGSITKIISVPTMCVSLHREAAEAKKTDKEKEERTNTVRTTSSIPFSDILLRTEVQSDIYQEGRSERDDSDFEEELELGFETSMSDDEGHEMNPMFFREVYV
ncbi:hypothetical protein QJS10_CPB19g01541 [Acorus calamus]|uniref:Uncharacterized protein n=1 Tax=Acorus calamus TaxID=4465 RepID=A0AAV9CD81_ACOCL|nr:hypothetical protein QJS10_CPB19g01541 [Acorus calamus]